MESSISWSTLGLTVTDLVNGHVECTYSLATSTWSSPRFVTDPYLRIHGLSPALNYGQQCYEGLKALRSPSPTNAITIFRPRFHAARMAHSAAVVSLPPVPEDLFLAAISLAVQRNAEFVGPADSSAVLYIRPLLFGSGPQLALEPPAEFTFAVYVQPATTYHGTTPLPCLIMEGFDRAATRGVGNAKVGGNYAPVMRHSREAKAKGFYVTLHLDSATMAEVEEFSTSGFVGVRKPREGVEGEGKGTLVVPDSKQVIDSVTSDSLQEVARGLGYTVEKRKVPYEELREFSEVLAVGTAASVLPIAAIVRESTGDKFVYCPTGKPGPAAVELGAAITATIRGEVEDTRGWLYEVPFPEEKAAPLKLNTGAEVNGIGVSKEELEMVMSPI